MNYWFRIESITLKRYFRKKWKERQGNERCLHFIATKPKIAKNFEAIEEEKTLDTFTKEMRKICLGNQRLPFD